MLALLAALALLTPRAEAATWKLLCQVGTSAGGNHNGTWSKISPAGGGNTWKLVGACGAGSCGPAAGTSFPAPAPTANLCVAPAIPINIVQAGGIWTWTCQVTTPPSSTTCTATVAAGCGSANGGSFPVAPTGGSLCNAGWTTSAPAAPSGSNWTWTCYNTATGASDNCSAIDTAAAGGCGSADGGTFATAPSGAALCAPGFSSATAPTLSGISWQWTCQGGTSGSTNCSASVPASGSCGPANGQLFTSPPDSSLLCAAPATLASGPSQTGSNWIWACVGNGSTGSCTAGYTASTMQTCPPMVNGAGCNLPATAVGGLVNNGSCGTLMGFCTGFCGATLTWVITVNNCQ
jgi:hypothetical protein